MFQAGAPPQPRQPPPAAHVDALPQSFGIYAESMRTYQETNLAIARERRAVRQQNRARDLAEQRMRNQPPAAAEPPAAPTSEDPQAAATCGICIEDFEAQDIVCGLACSHKFHMRCLDTWCAHALSSNMPSTCPYCREPVNVTATDVYQPPQPEADVQPMDVQQPDPPAAEPAMFRINTPSDPGSEQSSYPWWPTSGGSCILPEAEMALLANTRLPDGRLGFIVDPGAWTSLVGKTMARLIAAKAMAYNHKPQQSYMQPPLEVAGVGNGTQTCNYRMTVPVAVPHVDGTASLHSLTAPIVEGTGEDLPGLLGLRTLEGLQAILDTGNRQLHFPGPGTVKIELPPGSISVPLEKAPSGHLIMPLDAYDKVPQTTGGLDPADSALTLITQDTPPVLSSTASSSTTAAAAPPLPPVINIDSASAPTEEDAQILAQYGEILRQCKSGEAYPFQC